MIFDSQEAVEVQVRDQRTGPARASAPGVGNGLVGMRERVQLLGGTLSAGPVDSGWQVTARLPAPVLVAS